MPAVSSALVAAGLAWLSTNAGLPVPETMPTVQAVPQCQIAAVIGADCRKQRVPVGGYTEHFPATEHHPAETIVLIRDTFDPSVRWDMSLLVHELCHVAHGPGVPVAQGERVCFAAQDKWLRQHGSSLAEKVSPRLLAQLTGNDPKSPYRTGGF